jgi:hypothetical protein
MFFSHRQRSAFIPFSYGPRSCVGRNVAEVCPNFGPISTRISKTNCFNRWNSPSSSQPSSAATNLNPTRQRSRPAKVSCASLWASMWACGGGSRSRSLRFGRQREEENETRKNGKGKEVEKRPRRRRIRPGSRCLQIRCYECHVMYANAHIFRTQRDIPSFLICLLLLLLSRWKA